MTLLRLTPFFLLALAAGAQAQYSFLVTETPSGSFGGPYTNGILRYNVDAAGNVTSGTGIAGAAGQIVDPAGLALASNGDLYVGNRFGNGTHPGQGSVSRFQYNAGTGTYVFNSNIATGATGTHGINVSLTTGELYAANVDGPVSRYVGGVANGTLNSGSARDVLISPDGQFAYVTQGINGAVLKFNAVTGSYINTYNVAGASGLHFGAWQGSTLYISDFGSGRVFGLGFNGAGDVSSAASIVTSAAAIGVAFSPDGGEMFVTGHTTNLISKFKKNGAAWTADGSIATNSNLGDIQVVAAVPEPATLAALGLGAAALLRRRRKA